MRICTIGILLAAILTAGAVAPKPVETEKTILLDVTQLRTETPWNLGGNRVYFGQYEGEPMVWRVLPQAETQSVEDSLLLDCETILKRKAYDDNFWQNEGQEKLPSEWKGSDIEAWLNGMDFYGRSSVFSYVERRAIAETTLAEMREPYSIGHWVKMYWDIPSTDRVFLLSAGEADALYANKEASAKTGASTTWWLRSAFDFAGNGAGSVPGDGHICNNSVSNFVVGGSPACNVKLSSILFATPAGDDAWKLTLLDERKSVTVTEVTRDNDLVTVTYTVTGPDVNQISVLLANRDGTEALYYGALEESFLLPESLQNRACGADYHAYLLAEKVSGGKQSHYASPMAEFVIP